MKKILGYVSFVLRSSPIGFFTGCLLSVSNLIFAAGLYAVASFIISLSALHPTYDVMMLPVVSVRLFGLGRAVLSYAERYYSHNNTFRILQRLRLKLYDRMVPALPDYTTGRAVNLSKIISDIELLQEGILRLIYPLLSALLLLITGSVVLLLISPMLASIFIPLFLINYFIFPAIMFRINSKKQQVIDYDKQKLYSDLLEIKEGINEITSNNQEEEWLAKLERRLMGMNGDLEKHQTLVAASEAITVFLRWASQLCILTVAVYLVSTGRLSGVSLAAATLGISTLVTEMMLPGQVYFKFNGLKRAAANVFDTEVVKETTEQESLKLTKCEDWVLTLDYVGWSYDKSKVLLEDISLELKKGMLVAVTGESGSGKSTLINLMLGFIKPDSGHIYFNQTDIHRVSERERLSLYSVVDQKPFFFHQSIYDNLCLANPKANEQSMYEVLSKVSLLEMIEQLPSGIHTSLYEWSANLSGGEVMRLAIARALLREAPIYIFDEPTAGLDTINEKLIMDLILELSKDHGVLLITHRPVIMDKFHTIIKLR